MRSKRLIPNKQQNSPHHILSVGILLYLLIAPHPILRQLLHLEGRGAATAMACPADPNIRRVIKNADGKLVTVQLRGDEHCHWWKAVDSEDCYVEDVTQQGRYVRTTAPILPSSERETMVSPNRPAVSAQRPSGAPSLTPEGNRRRAPFLPRTTKQLTGERRLPVILIEFPDVEFTTADLTAQFDRVFNAKNYREGRFSGSVSEYFSDQSNGQLTMMFDIIGPVTVSKEKAYYGKDGENRIDLKAGEMIKEAVILADATNDFRQYDWDGDGRVEQVIAMVAGVDQATGGTGDEIWSHASMIYTKCDNVTIMDYCVSSELREISGALKINSIGVICHELGHCFGIPDFYNQTTNTYGTNKWDIMGLGVHNDDGYTPAGFTAYNKMFCGWQMPIVLESDVVVDNMEAMSRGGDFYLIPNDACDNEYFLLENRQWDKWDKKLPWHGMLITHVDYDEGIFKANKPNVVDKDNDHERMAIVLADNSSYINYSDYNRWLECFKGDLYPYHNNNSLTNTSVPAAKLYNQNIDGTKLLSKPVTQITEYSNGTMGFVFKNVVATFDIAYLEAGNHELRYVSDTSAKLLVEVENKTSNAYNGKLGAYVRKIDLGEQQGETVMTDVNIAPKEAADCEFVFNGLADNTDYEVVVFYYPGKSADEQQTKELVTVPFNMAGRNRFTIVVKDEPQVHFVSPTKARIDVELRNESFKAYSNYVDAISYILQGWQYVIQEPRASVSQRFDAYSNRKFTFWLDKMKKGTSYDVFLYYHPDSEGNEWEQLYGPITLVAGNDSYAATCDVNRDGTVDVGDIMAVINAMAGALNTSGERENKADVNGDGTIDVGDIMAIINAMATL